MLEDPFVGTNEKNVQWVGEKTWVFTSHPFSDPSFGNNDKPFKIIANSTQTYSSWYLNDELIGSTQNSFILDEFIVTGKFMEYGNILRVEFTPPSSLSNDLLLKAGHPLPGDESRSVHRMPQFAFGWDWGPMLVDFSVNGLYYDDGSNNIEHINLSTTSIEDNVAKGIVNWTYTPSDSDEIATMRWAISNENGVKVAWGNTTGASGVYSAEFEIEYPELWWTHDTGKPYLYKLEVIAYNSAGLVGREVEMIGIRTLELNTENGAFQFILNGMPIYSQGANFIPCDVIENRVNPHEEEAVLDLAIDANMNTIRVWGGGRYATDHFMEMCDEKGLLVWHDFMFACAMYPGNDEFLETVKEEAEEATLRLRHHPSLAIWCGNNEISEGWARWGWKDGLSKSEVSRVDDSYNRVFKEILPDVVGRLDDAPYWESSPKFGRGDERFKSEGDAHDWGIWHDGYSFDSLWTRVPRYMSEYGFQSFPVNATFKSILSHDSILKEVQFRDHPEIVAHEKHPRGFDIIDSYLSMTHSRSTSEDIDFDQWSYLSRVIQAEGISEGAKAGRLNQEHCSGTLVWQLNDCWPVASWSSIDGHGRKKLLHYKLKEAFSPILINGDYKDGVIKVGITANPGFSDETITGSLIIDVKTLDDQYVNGDVVNLDVTSGQTTWMEFPSIVPVGSRKENIVVHLKWKANDSEQQLGAQDRVYLVDAGDIDLKKGSIYIKRFGWSGDDYLFEVSSNTYVKDLELYTPHEANFDKNGFDLFPGETKRITLSLFDVDIFSPGMGSTEKDFIPVIKARSLTPFSNDKFIYK